MTRIDPLQGPHPLTVAKAAPLVFLVAGEPSGDQLGARLMRALREKTGGRVRFAGVGGPRMASEGLESLFPIDELAVMGILEVVPHLWRIYRRIRQTVTAARLCRPDIVVTIDSPSFTLQISQRLKGQGMPLVHFVAPQVWAWKAWRAKHVARYLDRLLALLPFEPPYFEAHGLPTSFVGHPAIEAAAEPADGSGFRRRNGIPDEAPLLCVLPGSRRSEVRRLLPVFGVAVKHLKARFPDLRIVVPTLESLTPRMESHLADWEIKPLVLTDSAEKLSAYAASNVALAASGTVAVELAVARVPAVIAYRTNALTAHLAVRFLKIAHVSLPNILLGRGVLPELLQWNCTPERITEETARLLTDPAARAAQIDSYAEVIDKLSPPGVSPSRRAADVICELMVAGGSA